VDNIQYYVIVDKTSKINKVDKAKIDKVEIEIQDTRLPFSDKHIDLYLISNNKKECKEYIEKLDKNIQKYFIIKQVGSKIQYTAFVDILGFSNYIKTNITNDDQAEELYEKFNEIVEYLQSESKDEIILKNAEFFKDITIKYSWVSDTFVISIQYMNEVKKDDENVIKGMMVFRLSMIIASIHHFVASQFGLIVRGGISSKYSCITNNFILGEGVVKAHKLENDIAVYPRVVFEQSIINDEVYEIITRHYRDNDLDFISKDCDGYYFVNYLAILQYIPPMIGKTLKIPKDKIRENAIKQKINMIEKYQKIVVDGLKIPNEKVKSKYNWLNNYLGRVLLNKKFQKNIINN
jgi:hypothetical protein